MARTTRIELTVHNVLTLADGMYLDTARAAPEQFYLLVRNAGRSRIFLMRYTHLQRQREKSYGPVRDHAGAIRLKAARDAAKADRGNLAKGIDPNPPKTAPAPVAEGPKVVTVWDDCMTWYEHEEGAWSESYRKSVMGWMEYDIGNPADNDAARKPLCGHLETTALTPSALAALFYRKGDATSLWLTKNETCQRVISILRRAIDHAIAADDDGRWKDRINPVLGLSARLPKGKRPDPVSRRAVPYERARAYYQRLVAIADGAPVKDAAMPHARNHNGGPPLGPTEAQRMAAHCLLTMIETLAPRTAEVLNMTWQEMGVHPRFGDRWVVPAGKRGRVKNKRNDRNERDFPLLACTLERLNALRPADATPTDYVFRGRALKGKRLGQHQMRFLMTALAEEFGIDATPHGWRTTAKSWGKDHAEHVNDKEAMEVAQDRVTETAAGDRYNDTTLMVDRRRLAERFIAYLGDTTPDLTLVADNDNPAIDTAA